MGSLLLVLAGFGAGLSGSMAGLASLFSFPALLAVGLPPTVANQTNTVALAVASSGSILSSRPELRGQGRRVLSLLPLVAAGGAVGAALVLVTPADAFALIVPFLVAAASIALLVPPSAAAGPAAPGRGRRAGRAAAIGLVAVYAGYFGAAAGVVLLALLTRVLADSLVRVNALKNTLLGAANAVAAVGFAAFGHVSARAAVALTVGVFGGNYLGPVVARRLPARVLRVGIAVAGLGLAVVLFVRAVTG